MNKTIFFTGFPGFIGKHLIIELLKEPNHEKFYFLVQEKFLPKAKEEIQKIYNEIPQSKNKFEIIIGDITKNKLGLLDSLYNDMTNKTNIIFHLAAIYDLSAKEEIAQKINVFGTTNIINFAKACKNLIRFNYYSTCYVSGLRAGRILENELDLKQGFKNFYESTKFEAECLVQKEFNNIPTTIFRPGIVIGDSQTGQTDKYDGPYFIINFLLKNKLPLPMIHIGKSDAYVNITPVDYLVKACTYIVGKEESKGKVFQIADPNPLKAKNILALICDILNKKLLDFHVPQKLGEAIFSLKSVQKLTGIPKEALVYFNHDAYYDSTNTQSILSNSKILCPRPENYFPNIINFVKSNPDLRHEMKAKW
jgi:thioester reductase-like protein